MKKDIEQLKKESRDYSIKEGIFATIKSSLGSSYISPFAIAINSGNSMIALFSSIPGLLGPISQWLSSTSIEKYPRKKILLTAVFFEILAWIPLILIAFLYYQGIIVSTLPLLTLLFFSLYIVISNAGHPAWFSWMGDLVNENKRGKWFAKRTFIFGVTTIITTVFAAIFLDFFKKSDFIMIGFMILFFLAMVSRIVSRHYLKKQYEPKLELQDGYYFSFFKFIKKAPFNNFGRFAIFRSLLAFSTAIGGPFFAVYMLRTLNFNYFTFMMVTIAQTVFSLVIIRAWGQFSDKFGNYEILKITSILISIFPILWLFSENPLYLMFGPQLIGGMAWAGFHLAAGNFIFDSVTPQKRSLVVSYYNLLHGVGIFLGATLGAIIVKVVTIQFMDLFLFMFLISAVARMIVSLVMIPTIKEVRDLEKFSSSRAFKSLIFKSIKYPGSEDSYELKLKKKHSYNK